MQGVSRKLDSEKSWLGVNGDYLSHLRFADDIALFSKSGEHMQKMLQDLHSEGSIIGLKMNTKKSKAMSNRHAESLSFSLGNEINIAILDRLSVLIPTTRKKSGTKFWVHSASTLK